MDRVHTVFDGMTDNCKYVGPLGSSLKLKTVNDSSNYLSLIENLAASCDAVTPLADGTHAYFRKALEARYEKRDLFNYQ
jgi:hypothetical protein